MFDDNFDMFDRDGGRGRAASEQRGWRGVLARMLGGGDDNDDTRQGRYREEADYDGDDNHDEGRAAPRRRRRDNDGFDFGD